MIAGRTFKNNLKIHESLMKSMICPLSWENYRNLIDKINSYFVDNFTRSVELNSIIKYT